MATYALTNLAAQEYLTIEAEPGQDVLALARDRLANSDFPEIVRSGFFLSVFPDPAGEEPVPTGEAVAGERNADPVYDSDDDLDATDGGVPAGLAADVTHHTSPDDLPGEPAADPMGLVTVDPNAAVPDNPAARLSALRDRT